MQAALHFKASVFLCLTRAFTTVTNPVLPRRQQGRLARADMDALHLHSCNHAHDVVAKGSYGLPMQTLAVKGSKTQSSS